MSEMLAAPSVNQTPLALLEKYIGAAAARSAPIAVDSPEGSRLYRALAQHVWNNFQRPVSAGDIRDLWERIDTIKRGAPVNYGLCGIHFWAADLANSLSAETLGENPEYNERLAAWLEDWPNVCILGHTGRGKSSTINRLFGVKMADISHHQACTDTVSDYRLVTGRFLERPTGIVMWDVPGYGDQRLSWDRYVHLYRRLARKCDVVVLMLDNDRLLQVDLKMFKKLRKRVQTLDQKLVVAINKADLFHPYSWDETANAPSPEMQETLRQRVGLISDLLDFRNVSRIVPMSALRNWNIYTLLTAMVDAAGESKGSNLLRAARPDMTGTEGAGRSSSGSEYASRFGISPSLRAHFRAALAD